MSLTPTAAMKLGTWVMVAGVGMWLLGGTLLLLVSLIWWQPASGTIAGVVGWGMGSGTAIFGGACLVISGLKSENAGLKAENDRLRAAGSAEPGAAADGGGM